MLAPAAPAGYREDMALEDIKDAVVHLTSPELQKFADWFGELREDEWDRQMQEDFSPGGRASHLAERIDREIDRAIATGTVTSLEAELRARREQRAEK